MFDPIMEQILAIARDAWAFMAGLLIVVALLGGLYFILQGTAGMAFGGSRCLPSSFCRSWVRC